jgi:hypothetical protein
MRALCKDCDGSCGDECEMGLDDWVESDIEDVERWLNEHTDGVSEHLTEFMSVAP